LLHKLRPWLRQQSLRLGRVCFSLGELGKAARLFSASLELRGELNDLWGQAFAHNNLAKVAIERGDFAAAERELRRAEQLFGRIDSRDGLMVVLANWGRLWLRRGEARAALPPLNRALQLALEIGKWSSYGLGDIYLLLGEARLNLGEPDLAGAAITEALRLVETAGNTEYIAGGLALRARLLAEQGQADEARAVVMRARQLAQQAGGQLLPARVERLAGLGNG